MNSVIELILDDDEESGVYAYSLVDRPATKANWIALSEQHIIEFKEIETKKNILIGAVLIPNLKIPRIDETTKEVYDVFFSGETIEKIAYKFMKNGYQKESTLQHKSKIDGVTIVETWLKEDMVNDKSVKYGFNYPVKTWFVAISVENEEIKEKIKKGEIKGISIEGSFDGKKEMNEDELIFNELKELLTN